jgi:hypothetical protein
LLRLMRLHGELALWVTQHISQDYASTCREIRDLILSDSASEKLALDCWWDGSIRTPLPKSQPDEAGSDSRRDRADDRHFAGDRQPAVRGLQEAAADPAERFYTGDP